MVGETSKAAPHDLDASEVGQPHQYVLTSVSFPRSALTNGIEIQMYFDPAGSAMPQPRFESSGRPDEMSPKPSLNGPFPMYSTMTGNFWPGPAAQSVGRYRGW